jgi:hypothetical protein
VFRRVHKYLHTLTPYSVEIRLKNVYIILALDDVLPNADGELVNE